ncbi:polyketide synthase [Hypoxylon sp. EC38]|nr:polyketide synthase [Hypoxylon sp. EC38]
MDSTSEQDHHDLIENFNITDDTTSLGLCVHHLFERAAEQYKGSTALICADIEMTFETLNGRANQFALTISQLGVGPGDIVGVIVNRSINLVVTLLAVLKTGAAYVPIDPASPGERIRHMLEDTGPRLIVTDKSAPTTLEPWKDLCTSVDESLGSFDLNVDNTNLETTVQARDLAYIIYTSGSTGRPKGVEISHGSVSNLLLSMQHEPGCGERDRLLAITTISFDMAALELFLPLISGATLVLAQKHEVRDGTALLGLMERHSITILQATPATWQILLESGWQGKPRLAKILCGGEALTRTLADHLLDFGDLVWNMYGPTEATVYASIWRVRRGEDILIGSPITNSRLYVLREDLSPAPPGCSGELYIGGSGIARCYHNNPELTQSRFLDNPFHGGLLYRTGDIACFLAPGKLKLLGRVDSQVKIRGFRVELGEVESTIISHHDISRAVVVTHEDRLIAYYEREKKACLNGEMVKVSLEQTLRRWLSGRLPAYMMPAFFIEMDSFPLTLSGKIDRRALPDPVPEIKVATQLASDIEGCILTIWSQVLGHDRIDVNANFFEVGGDSVRLVRVHKELEKLLGRKIPQAKLFEHYTIKTLTTYLTKDGTAGLDTNHIQHLSHSKEDIAIVSTACRLPGGVSTPEEYWELLESGGDGIIGVPKSRWDAAAIFDADPEAPGKSYCRRGGFIEPIDCFDAAFFGISPREARALDPTHHVMLETCYEAFERGGYTMEQLRGSQTGVFIGISNISAYHQSISSKPRGLEDLDGYAVTGTASATVSGRVSYNLGLEGPSMTIDAACSSSLVATHLACNALRQGECNLAVAGGVSLLLSPGLHVEFSRLGGMSPDGYCRPFSADTQGTSWGEGSVAVVLKRLSDAQRDGDRIHAVLRGTAVNHGGRSASLTSPSGPAQQRLIRTVLAASSLHQGDIDYVETHGTGTKLGDPIEGTVLAEVFGGGREKPLWIGSVKSNIGHTQAAAGLAGLLKVVLAITHSTLPRTLHTTQPTPAINWECANMRLVQENRHWLSKGRPRRAGISAFGIGGTNAHVIIEEPPGEAPKTRPSASLLHVWPFILSGHTGAALREQARKLRYHLSMTEVDPLSNVAYSLATTRTHFPQRMVLVAKDKAELLEKLAAASIHSSVPAHTVRCTVPSQEPHLAMIFTGQGGHLINMGKELYETFPVFGEALDEIGVQFKEHGIPILDIIWANPETEEAALLQRTDFVQPALFALEVSLFRLWKSWGVNPKILLGHSIGELVVAHVAGIINLPDAIRIVAARGRLMQKIPESGKMVSLEANAAEASACVETLGLHCKVDIACHNTPTQMVISGDTDAVERVSAHFINQGRRVKPLEVSCAFHSHHMDSILADFRIVVETARFHPSKLTIVSGMTGKLAEQGELERPDYWVLQARREVRFSEAVKTLHEQGINTFLELGPQPVLSGLIAANLADHDSLPVLLPSLVHGKSDIQVTQRSLAELHVRHANIDWIEYFRPFDCQRVELPTYAFQRERFSRNPWLHPKENSIGINSVTHASTSLDRFQFEINWHEVNTDSTHLRGSWGLLCPDDDIAWVLDLKSTLLSTGIRLIPMRHLEEASGLDGLFCLWDSSEDALLQAHEFTTKALQQLQDAIRANFIPELIWITHQAVGINTTDRVTGLGAAPLWGLARTARNECPDLRLRLIDLDEGKVPPESMISALSLQDEPECAVRKSAIFAPRLQHMEPPRINSTSSSIKQESPGAILITGAFGGVGQRVARWLVSTHGVRDLVLMSRHGMESAGAKVLVDELALLGAKPTVFAGNVADADSVKSMMAIFTSERPLRGVIHAAGVVSDGVLSALTPERCEAVSRPKVDGAYHLHRFTQDMDLDFFVMFSSISGIMGTPGQGNYAAANTFLDALAQMRRARGLPATSIAWGLWDGDGMGASLTGTGRLRYAQSGLDPLTSEHGLKLLEQGIRGGQALTVAAALNLERLQAYHEDRGVTRSLLRSLLKQGGKSVLTNGDGNLRDQLSQASHKQQPAVVLDIVKEAAAHTLGFGSPDDVDIHSPLQAIGIDSLTAVILRNQLAKRTNLTLSPRIAFQFPNLTALSQYLLSQLQEKSSAAPETSKKAIRSPATRDLGHSMAAIRKGYLDPTLTFNNEAQAKASPKSVFITGATGFVGAFILHELLEMGIKAYCVIRAEDSERATQRLVDTLAGYDLWKSEYKPLLKLVIGDIAQPFFGLAHDIFDEIVDSVDAICHVGALVDWMRPLDDYIGPNVVSTHEVLRLASRGRPKAIHCISTVTTLPKHLGYEITESDREYGYATSKYMAERMVSAARWRGATASVYRFPFITASAKTGHFRRDRGDFLHNLIAGSIQMSSFPSVDADLSAVLSVDYLCKIVANVMTRDLHLIGQDFDFVNKRAPNFKEFFKLMCEASVRKDIVPFDSWRERALAYAAAHRNSPLARISVVLDGLNKEAAAAMLKSLPTGKHVFGDDDTVPSFDGQYVRKYLARIEDQTRHV